MGGMDVCHDISQLPFENVEELKYHERAWSARSGGIRMQLKKLQDRTVDQLFEAILTLRTVEECYIFFDDLCTVNEIQSLSQRLEVARMLGKGYTYSQIEAETGASTATISRVKRCLNYGNDGYKMALERLEAAKAANKPLKE
jgi:TrpR-related protein YerC/YecD